LVTSQATGLTINTKLIIENFRRGNI
jgi:hypothetical protein